MKTRPKVIDVVGARPQFIKVAAVSRAMTSDLDYVLLNTDQHYDERMSRVFFSELKIRKPAYSLGVGSGSHAQQTAKMMMALEEVFVKEKPQLVQVYGDTNSTIAAALVAAKLRIPVSHVEAGLRSFNRAMPEEINRIATDHISDLLFVPTRLAEKQLKKEGVSPGQVYWVGDVMLDVVKSWKEQASVGRAPVAGSYVLATIHRAENTDDIERLKGILEGLGRLKLQVVLPIHPRLEKMIGQFGVGVSANFKIVQPLSHFEMMSAIFHSKCVVTDSGGLQKEAFYMDRFCVTVRDETEWKELVAAGVNEIVGTSPHRIQGAVERALKRGPSKKRKALLKEYGDGVAASRIVKVIKKFLA